MTPTIDVDPQAHATILAIATAEAHRKTAGQRRINVIWEITQAYVAVAVSSTTLYVASVLTYAIARGETSATVTNSANAAFLLLSNAFFLVIGFYFGRTNHQRSGGVGGADAGPR